MSAPASAAATSAVEASSTGVPASAASLAAATLVTAPPVPDAGCAGLAELHPVEFVAVRHAVDALRPRFERRLRVERVDIRQQHEQIGVHQARHQCGEAVVVAEPDLVGRDGVVLVDDGQDAQPHQPLHGALRVAAVLLVGEVAGGEQHLPGDDAVAVEAFLVTEDEHVLADRRGRLLGGQVGGSTDQLQIGQSGGDGAGGHQDDFGAARVRRGQGVDQFGNLSGVGAADRR